MTSRFRTALLAVSITMAVVFFSSMALAQSTTKTIAVVVTQPWTDTGSAVKAGQSLSITATGTMNYWTGSCAIPWPGFPDCIVTPDGIPWPGPCDNSVVAPGLACVSLIGRIGSGNPFEVGTSLQLTAAADGELFLGVNDGNFPDNSGSWTAAITEAPSDYKDVLSKYFASARRTLCPVSPCSATDLQVAQLALSGIIGAREQPGQSTDPMLRDAEYSVRNWIGAQVAIGKASGLDLTDYYDYLVVGNPLAVAAYNAEKLFLNAFGEGSWLRANAQNPNSEPGGWDAAVDGYFKGYIGLPLNSLLDRTSPSTTQGTDPAAPLSPIPVFLNSNSNINVFVAAVDGQSTYYFDPPIGKGFEYDVGVGPLVKKIVVPSSSDAGTLLLQFQGRNIRLQPDTQFDFTQIDPAGAATFKLLSSDQRDADKRGRTRRDEFVVGLEFMHAGVTALSQEPLPFPKVLTFAFGRYAPGTPGQDAEFALAALGPDIPAGLFAYRFPSANLKLVSTKVSHVSFVGQAAVIRGSAKVNGANGYTFVVTVGRGQPASLGLEIRGSDGALYFEAGQTQLPSGCCQVR